MSTRKIITSHVYPPIPVRTSDWCAHYDGEEEAGNYGWGATEEEAIADFIENYAEDHDERLSPVKPELRAIDCTTTKQWEQWARERREYDDPCGQNRSRY